MLLVAAVILAASLIVFNIIDIREDDSAGEKRRAQGQPRRRSGTGVPSRW